MLMLKCKRDILKGTFDFIGYSNYAIYSFLSWSFSDFLYKIKGKLDQVDVCRWSW